MRVLLWADMEGMSRIADHRECWPEFPPYWQTGRRTFTGEVVAAATGLLHGGASAVLVVNGHGLGWPNVLWDELPERVAPPTTTPGARASTRCSRPWPGG
jgi:D-amino peptidase